MNYFLSRMHAIRIIAATLIAGTVLEMVLIAQPSRPDPQPIRRPTQRAANQVEACQRKAMEAVQSRARSFKSADEMEQYYMIMFHQCRFPELSSSESEAIARYKMEQAKLARLYASGKLTSDQYLSLLKNLQQKMKKATSSKDYADALQRGDQDGDLVPDQYDQCRETPSLTPTDDHGCPIRIERHPPLPDGQIRRVLRQQFVITVKPECQTLPPPKQPTPVAFKVITVENKKFLEFSISRVEKDSAACDTLYEVRYWGTRCYACPFPTSTEFEGRKSFWASTVSNKNAATITYNKMPLPVAPYVNNASKRYWIWFKVRAMGVNGQLADWSPNSKSVEVIEN